MSLYAQAAQSGVSTLALVASGSNAESEAAKAAAYNNQARRIAAAGARSAAERNISAIAQDKIVSNLNVRLRQSQAEAMKTLQSAFAGVEGGSVEDSNYVVQAGAENLVAANNQRAEQATEQQLARVNQSHSAMLSVTDEKISTVDRVLQDLGSFELSDLKMAKDIKQAGGITKLWSD